MSNCLHRATGVAALLLALAFAPGATAQTVLSQPNLQLTGSGTVLASVQQADGKLIIAGSFRNVNGTPRSNLARLNADGTVDAAFNPSPDGSVDDIAIDGNNLYLVGSFFSIGGVSSYFIGKVDLTTGAAVAGWGPGASGNNITSVAAGGGAVFIGGYFTTLGATPKNYIAKLDPATGAIDGTWLGEANGIVSSLHLSGADLYVGGVFDYIGGQFRNRIARLNAGDGTAQAWNPNGGSSGSVDAILADGAVVYLAGSIPSIGGTPINKVARVDTTTGALDTGWLPTLGVGNQPLALAKLGSLVYVAGNLNNVGGQTRYSVGALDVATASGVAAFNPGFDFNISRTLLITSGGELFAGGSFTTTAGGVALGGARLSPTTGALIAPVDTASSTAGSVSSIARAADGSTYAGGSFLWAGDSRRTGLVRLNPDGSLDTAWNANLNGTVSAVAVSGSRLYVAGAFTQAGATARAYLAELSMADGTATAWNPAPNVGVSALAADDTSLFVGGGFTTIAGSSRSGLAKFATATGALDGAWAPACTSNCSFSVLALGGGQVFAFGTFAAFGAVSKLAKIDAATGAVDSSWTPNPNDSVAAIVVDDTNVYVGGWFTTISGVSRSKIAKLTVASSAADPFWMPNPGGCANACVYSLGADPGGIYVGGLFSSIGGQSRQNLAKLQKTGNGTAIAAWSANASGQVSKIVPIAGGLMVGGSFSQVKGVGTASIAALVAASPTATTSAATSVTSSAATLNGSANPNGMTTTGWFRYSATNPGTCNDSFGTRAPVSSASDSALGAGSTSVAYSRAISGLSAGTTYYYCAIASNGEGTAFGAVLSFTPPAAAPAVTTSSATLLTGTGATLNGSANPGGADTTGWFRYSSVSPGTCNDSFGTRAPAAGGSSLGAGTSMVAYSQAISGLSAGTTYYFCAIASNSMGTGFGAVTTLTTPSPPTATTSAATGVANTSATLNGSADPNGAATTGWFRYSATNPGTCNDTFGTRAPAAGGNSLGTGTSMVAYSQAVSGLNAGTTYYYCAIAANTEGTAFGSMSSFTTLGPPAVTTSAATSLTSSSATLNGSGNPNGAAATGWFRYDTASPGTCNDTFGTRAPVSSASDSALGAGSTSVAYSRAITGLSAGTTYYYCAIASNAYGTAFGAVLSFTTPAAAPAVTTSSATSLSATGATLNGSANPGGAATTGWFRYSSVSPGTCNDSFGTRAPAAGGSSLGAGTSMVAYSQAISGLSAGTTYYFCAIASNSMGTGFGAVTTLTTPSPPSAATSPATSVASTSATLNGSGNPNGAAATGWFRYDSASPGTCNDSFGTRAPVTPGTGTTLGAGSMDVAYSRAITGLSPGRTYYFCAIASNAYGISFGAVLSFTTPATAPAVTTLSANLLSATEATLDGTANPGGAATTGWFRYSSVSPGTCDDTFGTRAPAAGGSPLGAGASMVPYSEAISGLGAGTTYYYCAIAANSMGMGFGMVMSFTTPAAAPGPYDFNADGHPDIVWSNTANGATYVWHMSGPPPALVSDAFVAQIDPSWKVQGIWDFNGDGKPDLVWRNTANGNTYVWYMDGAAFLSDAFIFSLPPEWVIQGLADFNADARPDFLMRNVNSGTAFVWFFNDNVPIGDQFLFGIDPSWKVEQVGDLNADNQPDLLFRSMSSGLAFAWYTQYSGGTLSLAGGSEPIFSIDPVWEIVQLADWNGDNKPDLVFRNASSGVVFVWYLDGTTLGGSDYIIQIDPSWEIVPRR